MTAQRDDLRDLPRRAATNADFFFTQRQQNRVSDSDTMYPSCIRYFTKLSPRVCTQFIDFVDLG